MEVVKVFFLNNCFSYIINEVQKTNASPEINTFAVPFVYTEVITSWVFDLRITFSFDQ